MLRSLFRRVCSLGASQPSDSGSFGRRPSPARSNCLRLEQLEDRHLLSIGTGLEPVPEINPDVDRSPFAPFQVQESTTWVNHSLDGAPSSFDLRNVGGADYVTPVKDQGGLNSCWTFATYGSLESTMLMDGELTRDFSENDLSNNHGFDWTPNQGGNIYMSEAYLSRWDGPVDELDDPYHDYDDRPSPGGSPQYYVGESIHFDTAAEMKAGLMAYGAMYTSMRWESASFNSSDNTYYYSGSDDTNHGVAVVGWDDNMATVAPTDGAWLIKNSQWGTTSGDGGYFWLSYADTKGGKYGHVFHDPVDAGTYSQVYYHDEFGDVAEWSAPYAFNAFTANASEDLTAVQFWTQADGTSYDVRIYDTFSGGSLSGLLGSTTGSFTYAGMHTVDLPSAVSLTNGDDFYVYLHLTNGGTYPQAFDYAKAGYSSSSTGSAGESYYSNSGSSWTDLTTYVSTTYGLNAANFCIKALTAASAGEITVEGNDVNIVDGDMTPRDSEYAASDLTDFGHAGISGQTVNHTFTIVNDGGDTLTLTGASPVSISGTHSGDYSVTQPSTTTLAPGASTTFQITFDPSATGMRTATVNIASDDANEGTFNFDIQGKGHTYPTIFVDGFESGNVDNWTTGGTGTTPYVEFDSLLENDMLPHSGSYAAFLGDLDSGTYADSTMDNVVDLSGYAAAELDFSWLTYSLVAGTEYIRLDIYDGTWHNDVNGWAYTGTSWEDRTLDLSAYNLVSDFTIRFHSHMDFQESSDAAYVDNIVLTGLETADLDFGDAPDAAAGTGAGNYNTVAADNGPSHTIVSEIYMGATVDVDDGTLQNAAADADDFDQALPDDEDGLNNPTVDLVLTIGAQPRVNVTVTNTTGALATLTGWIDYNNDGVFDNASERAQTAVANGAVSGTATLTFPAVPAGFTGTTYARFRLSTDAAAADPTGTALDGEVEDYTATITRRSDGTVKNKQLINESNGNFGGTLYDQSYFGASIANLGDFDGDGIADLAVGASGHYTGVDSGAVWILLLDNDGTVKDEYLIEGDTPHASEFGSAVANLGDLDGDGVTDLAVGISHDDENRPDGGGVQILFLNSDGTVKNKQLINESHGNFGGTLYDQSYFGASLTNLGDFDGDGIVDLAVGASGHYTGVDNGAVWILLLNNDGTVKDDYLIEGDTPALSEFGSSVANVGDLDGDGVTDLAVGISHDDENRTDGGGVQILFLNSDGTVKSKQLINESNGNFGGTLYDQSYFGASLVNLGDLDGNGIADLAVGASGHYTGVESGAVWILLLNSDGTVKDDYLIEGDTPALSEFGSAVANMGDLDGDGVMDLAVGISHDDENRTDGGGVQILFLNESSVNEPPTVTLNNMVTTLPEDTDTSSRIKMADIVVTDDALGSNDLSLSGADATMFEIDGTDLFLKASAALDHETNPALDVTVEVDDTTVGTTPDDSASMSIAVTDVNEPPTVTLQNVTTTLPEDTNTSSRIKVADIVVTDDALGSNDLSLSSADATMFEIDGTELFLKASAVLDYETNPALDVTVEVDDTTVGTTPDDSASMSIAVGDVNEPPTVALQNVTTTLPEDTDTSSRIKVADIVVTDDALGSNDLSLSGADATMFEIDGTELFLKASAVLDYETNPALDVTVEVDDTTVGSTPDDSASMSIAVGDVNEPPTVALQNVTTTLPEDTDTSSRIKVADIVVVDDGIGTNDLSLSGTHAALFEIDGLELFIQVGVTLDFETNPALDVTVEVDDATIGTTPDDSDSMSVAVGDVNEPPTVTLQNVTTTLPEDTDTSSRIKVADIVVADDALGDEILRINETGASLAEVWESGDLFAGSGNVTSVLAIEDTNGDGHRELAVLQDGLLHFLELDDGGAHSVSFTLRETFSVPSGLPYLMGVEDMDSDGAVDVAIRSVWGASPGQVALLELDAGTFVERTTIMPTSRLRGAAVADLDGDGLFEVVTAESYTAIAIHEATGSDTYQTVYQTTLTGTAIEDNFRVGDSDDDGTIEFLITMEGFSSSTKSRIYAIEATGDNAYATSVAAMGVGGDLIAFAGVRDLNGNGSNELVFTDDVGYSSNQRTYVYEEGSISFQVDAFTGDGLGDTDGNGLGEIIDYAGGRVIVLESDGESGFSAVHNEATSVKDFVTLPIVQDVNGDGIDEFFRLTQGAGTDYSTLSILTRFEESIFEIDGTELFLKAGAVLDYETNPSLDVTVEVDDTTVGTTPDDSASMSIAVGDVNEPPTVALQNVTTTLPEDTDTSSRIKVADIVVTDDALGSNDLSLSGADATMFEIDGTELFLKASAILDYETNPALDVTVEVDDTTIGTTPDDSASMSIAVGDVNEPPTVALQNVTTTLPEDTDTSSRIKVADIVVTDDALGSNDLSLNGTDATMFEIDGLELYLVAGALLDFEGNPQLDVTVEVDDTSVGSTPDDTVALTLNLTDVAESLIVSGSDWPADGQVTVKVEAGMIRAVDSGGTDVVPPHALASVTDIQLYAPDAQDDTATIDFSGGNPIPTGGLTYDGGVGGNDALVLIGGTFTTTSYTFIDATAGSIDLDGSVITYTGLEPITASIDATNVTLNYSTTAETITVTDATGGQTTADSDVAGEMVTFNNPTGMLTINAGDTGDDIIDILSLAANYAAHISIDGQGGSDTVNVNGAVSLDNRDLTITADTIDVGATVATAGGDVSLTATGDATFASLVQTDGGNLTVHADSDGDGSGTFSLVTASGAFEEQAILHASDAQADDQFGCSVAISGDTAIMGAWSEDGGGGNSGAAYVFAKSAGGVWTQQAILNASDAQTNDQFGHSVAISGDTVIVGAYREDGGEGSLIDDGGAAYVFTRGVGSTWTQQAILHASDSQAGDFFGWSVSVCGDTAVVGAFSEDGGAGNPLADSGAAYVFTRDEGGTWTEQAILRASDAQPSDNFGKPVSISDGTVMVASTLEDGGAGDPRGNSGAVYVFVSDADGVWTEQAILRASDAQATDYFGASVSISGNTVAVGATGEDGGEGNPIDRSGAAYVFVRDIAGVWTEQTILHASDAQRTDMFGNAVSISGDTVIVGSLYEDGGAGNPLDRCGAAYIFTRESGSDWTEQTLLHASDARAIDYFGYSVSISGNTAIVGAWGEDGGSGDPLMDSGATYVFQAPSPVAGEVSSAGGDVSITAADVSLDGIVSGTGALSVVPSAASRTIGLGGGTGDFNLDDTELANLSDGFSAITIGETAAGTGAVDIDSAAFLDFVTIAGGTIHDHSGTDLTAPDVTLDGNIAPGQSPGLLSVDGNFAFATGSTFTAEIDGTTPGTGHDQLGVSGDSRTITLNGAELVVTLNSAPALGSQQVYRIVDSTGSGSNVVDTFTYGGATLNDGDTFTAGSTDFRIEYNPTGAPGDVTITEAGNVAPTDIELSADTVAENTDTSGGYIVGLVAGTDPNSLPPNNDLSFSVQGGADAARFTIDGSNNLVLTDGFLDFETPTDANGDGIYELVLRATDGGTPGLTYDEAFSVTVTDVNEPPTVTLQNVTTTLPEDTNTSSRIKVADIVVTDDALGSNDLSLSGTDATMFEIDGTELFLKASAALDYETNPALDVTVEVDDTTVGTTPDDSASMSIAVGDVNEPPTVALQNVTTTLPEDTDTSSRIKVADIVVTDDALGSNDLSLSSTDATMFEIDGTELFLRVSAVLDYETNPALDVTVEVDDTTVGSTPDDSASMSIAVGDVNEPPTVALQNVTTTLPEDMDTSSSRIKVADIVVTDDALGSNDLSLSGTDATMFEIDGTELFLKASAVLDYETNPALDITVKVDDTTVGTTPDNSASMSIAVGDVNEPPTVTLQNVTTTLPEDTDTSSRIKVADIVVTDDALGSNDLSLSGADATMFEIDGTDLFLKASAVLDYETNPTLDVTVEVDDTTIGTTLDDSDALTISVTDVNELDFGDAPAPYPTLLANNGARHIPVGPTLGPLRDAEFDGQPASNADGDDLNGISDDEGGVTFGSIQVGQLDASLTVNVQNAPSGAKLDAWIDFNGDGSWGGPGEQVADTVAVVNGNNAIVFDVPSWAIDGDIYARFRLSSAGNLSPSGEVADGEVEDHTVVILASDATVGIFAPHLIGSQSSTVRSVMAADLDGDGDNDVVTASDDTDTIAWYENQGTAGFLQHSSITTTADGTFSLFAADVDSDGYIDVLAAARNDSQLLWYRNDGATPPTFVVQPSIADNFLMAWDISAADVDQDGDMDVLGTSIESDRVAWFENDGSQNFTQHPMPTAADSPTSVVAADVDGDGDMDFLSASNFDNKVAWWENDGFQNFTERHITTTADYAFDVFPADVDGDGDLDAVVACNGHVDWAPELQRISWYENDGTPGDGEWSEHVIRTGAPVAKSVFAADMDGDGDVDVLSASGTGSPGGASLAWYKNDGTGTFTTLTIDTAETHPGTVYAADMDGDGDMDVAAADITGDITWYENLAQLDFGDAPTPYSTLLTDNGAVHQAVGATLGTTRDTESDGQPTAAANGDDMDGSDDEDGVTFGSIRVGQLGATITVNVQNAPAGAKLDAWIDFNADGSWGGPGEHIFDGVAVVTGDNTLSFDVPSWTNAGDAYARFRLSSAGDLSPSGAAADGEVEDHRLHIDNPLPGTGLFGSQQTIAIEDGPHSVFAADLDRDGDMDVVVACEDSSEVKWYENDGTQSFTTHVVYDAGVYEGPRSVFVEDIDGDGDLDIACVSQDENKALWLDNDGAQNFTHHVVSINVSNGKAVSVADVDTDGDMDLVSAAHLDNKILWHENHGDGSFSDHLVSDTVGEPNGVSVCDVDRDGDMDILSAGTLSDELAWHENDGNQSFTKRIVDNAADGVHEVLAADIDGDTDIDLVSANSYENTIAWYENDGNQQFSRHAISTSATQTYAVFAADIDGDGDIDVAAVYTGHVVWFKNDGGGNFNPPIIISTEIDKGASVFVADMDTDGDLDVLSGSYLQFDPGKVAWYENGDFDYGDAPDPTFPTLATSDGARHVAIGPMLGQLRDTEPDGQPSASTDGDDLAGQADEDGVALLTPLMPGEVARIQIDGTANSAQGLLNAWIDYNGNGTWEPAEQIAKDTPIPPSAWTVLHVPVPPLSAGTQIGNTHVRFRLSTAGGDLVTGAADDGEVEDYEFTIGESQLDYGDADDPAYSTLRASDGARHYNQGPTLGTSRDTEPDGQPTSAADGDDLVASDDEDGVVLPVLTASATSSTVTTVDVELQNADPASNRLDAWIDFNQDGDWDDSGEQIFTNYDLGTANGARTLSFTVPQDTGTNVELGMTFARFRLSTAGGLSPTGLAADGEVEDYVLTIIEAPAVEFTAVSVEDAEDAGDSVVVTLTRSGDTSLASQVEVAIVGGSGADGDDYEGSTFPKTITFLPTETSKIVAVPLIDDALYEPPENIILEVTSVANCSIGGQDATELVVRDDDGTLDLSWSIGVPGSRVVSDSLGNSYTTGAFTGTTDFDPSPDTFELTSVGDSDIFVAKYSAAGALVWAKAMGGTQFDQGIDLEVDSNGQVYVAGRFHDSVDFDPGPGVFNLVSAGSVDAFLLKLDAQGDFVWAKSIAGEHGALSWRVGVDGDGFVYSTGYFYGAADFDPGPGEHILDTGNTNAHDTYVWKLGPDGDFVWAAQLESGSGRSNPRDFEVTDSGDTYTTGLFFGGVCDFDPGPGTYDLDSANRQDIFVWKLNGSGDLEWARNVGGDASDGFDSGEGIAVDAAGNAYVTGHFYGTADFDPGPGTAYLTSNGSYDIFTWKLDQTGNLTWVTKTGGSGWQSISDIDVGPSGYIYLAGSFDGPVDFDPGPGEFVLGDIGASPCRAVWRLDPSGGFVWAEGDFSGPTRVNAGDDGAVYVIGGGLHKFLQPAIGDLVWYDVNADGIQDLGEPGVEGVTVEIFDSVNGIVGDADDVFVDIVSTDDNGAYRIDGLIGRSEYYLQFHLPDGYSFTSANVGSDDAVDSDADPASGRSGIVSLDPGQYDSTLDAGLIATNIDFGDAPDATQSGFSSTYPVTALENGARHNAYGAFMGVARDVEIDGTHSLLADYDDINGSVAGPPGDEDGVTFLGPLTVHASQSRTGFVDVYVDLNGTSTAYVDAWIDFNQDGDWNDPGETLFGPTGQVVTATGMQNLSFTIPANALAGQTFSRFRVSSLGGLAPTGGFQDGEVEDHIVEFLPEITIDDVTRQEGADGGATTAFTFTVTRSQINTAIDVDWVTTDGTATTGDADYAGGGGTLNFLATLPTGGVDTQTITVFVNEDSKVEADEMFTVDLTPNVGSLFPMDIQDPSGLGTIVNDDSATLTVGDVTQNEDAGVMTFTVTLDNAVQGGLTVDYPTSDGTALTGDSDYTAAAGTLTFSGTAGETQTFTVPITADTKVEANETFTVTLSNAAALGTGVPGGTGTITGTDAATGTIVNDDSATISIGDVTEVESDSGSSAFTMIGWNDGNLYDINPVTGATSNPRSTGLPRPIGIATHPTTGVLYSLDAQDESLYSINRTTGAATLIGSTGLGIGEGGVEFDPFTGVLYGISGGTLFTVDTSTGAGTVVGTVFSSGVGTSHDPNGLAFDSGGTLFIYDSIAMDLVEVDKATAAIVSVTALQNVSDSSIGGLDFDPSTGKFFLSSGSSLYSVEPTGVGTYMSSITHAGGIDYFSSGTTTFSFTVTLSAAVDTGVSLTVDTADGTAIEAAGGLGGDDYEAISGGTVSFATGDLSKTVTVTVNGDDVVEANENFFVNLSAILAGGRDVTFADAQGEGTITNDDSATLTVGDVTQDEDAGVMTFTVTLDNAVQGGLTVDYATSDGTALTSDSDYTAAASTLTFSGTAGETQTFTVPITADTKVEANETFTVTLSNAAALGTGVPGGTGTITGTDTATGTIVNDDTAPTLYDDIVGRASSSGDWFVAKSDGTSFANEHWGKWTTAVTWSNVLVGDFTGDGKDDVVGRADSTGDWFVAKATDSGFVTEHWGKWTTAVTWDNIMVGDFNGDGKDDLVGRAASSGDWFVGRSTGTGFAMEHWGKWTTAVNWNHIQVGDFNGDGYDDLVGRAPSSGDWFVAKSSSTNFATEHWGKWTTAVTWSSVLVGDFTGDGKDDLVGRADSSGDWFTSRSTGSSFAFEHWGKWTTAVTWDSIMVGDFNGDGYDDLIGRAPSSGDWFVARSSSTSFVMEHWGKWTTAVNWSPILTGDFTGDGKDDLAARADSSGDWFVSRSTGTSLVFEHWGRWTTAVPWVDVQVGDFDGAGGSSSGSVAGPAHAAAALDQFWSDFGDDDEEEEPLVVDAVDLWLMER